MRFHF